MKILKFILLTFTILLIAVFNSPSQTVDEIISKNIEAMGGKDIIKAITSVYMENTIEAMGNESASTTVILNGKGIKVKSDFNGQTMIQCYTDKSGWMINPMSGSADPVAMSGDQYKTGKSQIKLEDNFMDYATKGNKVELLGKEKLQANEAYKIKVTTADSLTIVYYIDATTFYVVKTLTSAEMMGQKMEVVSIMSNYEKTSYGYVIPKTTTVSYGDQFTLVMKLKKVEINKPIDSTIFDFGNLK